ncbi:RNaseH domain-containing protein [Deinococcus marmoris]|uniref:RNaseH domain-containing protein n=1 Tax=Deinococcus marmoris TaxID=249408 RepID=UPI0004979152|nr:RNaseH domain-containing protein [Deinococcus marmoris]
MANPLTSTTITAQLCLQATTETGAAPDVCVSSPAPTSGPSTLTWEKPQQSMPQCFVLPEGVSLVTPLLHVLGWQPEAAEVVGRLRVLLRTVPLRTLRALAECHIPGLQRLDDQLGTATSDQRGELAWSTEPDRDRLLAGGTAMTQAWITGSLAGIGRARDGDDDSQKAVRAAVLAAVQDLQDLLDRKALFGVQTLTPTVHLWNVRPSSNGTTRPGHFLSYPALADAVARALHGQAILAGNGAMRRVIPRHTQGRAELIGAPVREEEGQASSLVVGVRILSLPGFSQPLIALELYRKHWVTPRAPDLRQGKITGYVLGQLAHPWTVSAGASLQGVNSEYRELARAYGLDETVRAADLADQRSGRAEVVLHRHTRCGQRVLTRVSERDRAEAMRNVALLLAPLGLEAWTSVGEIRLCGDAPASTASADPDQNAGQDDLPWLARTLGMAGQPDLASSVLVIVHHPSCGAEAALARATIEVSTGDRVTVATLPLLAGVHGAAWQDTVQAIREIDVEQGVTGVLLIAPHGDRASGGGTGADPQVHWSAARQALIRQAQVPGEHLLPLDAGVVDSTADFHRRLCHAWTHLTWGQHGALGSLDGVPGPSLPVDAPKVVLGFTAIQRDSSQFGRHFVALAFRSCTRTARTEVRLAYEDRTAPHNLRLTPWESPCQILTRLAGASPVILNSDVNPRQRQAQYQSFVDQTIEGEIDGGESPLVIIDSTHAVNLWPWLADSRIDVENITFGALGNRNMKSPWQRAGLRLVRIRQDNAPQVIGGGPGCGAALPGQATHAGELARTCGPTRPAPRLLRVQGCQIPTYLSADSGPSCTGRREGGQHGEENAGRGVLPASSPAQPAVGPRPLEISVLLTQPGDGPDRLAGLVGRLSSGHGGHGGGTTLPTPLSFERVIRGYLAASEDPNLGGGLGAAQ